MKTINTNNASNMARTIRRVREDPYYPMAKTEKYIKKLYTTIFTCKDVQTENKSVNKRLQRKKATREGNSSRHLFALSIENQ